MPACGAQIFDVATRASLVFAGVARFAVAARPFVVVNAFHGPGAAACGEVVEFEQIEKAFARAVRAADDFWDGFAGAIAAFFAQIARLALVIGAFGGVGARSARATTIEVARTVHFATRFGVAVAIGIALGAGVYLALARHATRRGNMGERFAVGRIDTTAIVQFDASFATVGGVAVGIGIAQGANAAIAPMLGAQIDTYPRTCLFASFVVANERLGLFFAFATIGGIAVGIFIAHGTNAAIAPMQCAQIDARPRTLLFVWICAFWILARISSRILAVDFYFATIRRVAVGIFVALGTNAAIAPMHRAQIGARSRALLFARASAFWILARISARILAVGCRFATIRRVAVGIGIAFGTNAAIAPMHRAQIGARSRALDLRQFTRIPLYRRSIVATSGKGKSKTHRCDISNSVHCASPIKPKKPL